MIGMSFNQLGAFKEAFTILMTAAEMDDDRDLEVQFQYGLVLLCQLKCLMKLLKQLNKVPSIDSQHVDGIYIILVASKHI